MVDKTRVEGDDNWDNWDEDFSLDLDFDEPKDDRKPITRYAIGVAKGAAEDLTSYERMKEIARNALPKGYSDGMDLIDSAVGSTKELYNEAVRDILPKVQSSKRLAAQLTKKYRASMPDFSKKILEQWEREAKEEDERKQAEETLRQRMASAGDDEIARKVAEALGESANQSADQFAEQQAKESIRDDIADKRYAVTNKQMSAMQEGVAKMVGFNNEFAARYMRKSLELKYRSLAIQRASFDQHKKLAEVYIGLLQNIQKNTALPDAAKAKMSEEFRRTAYQRFFGNALNAMSSFENRFFADVKKNLATNALGALKGVVSGAHDALSGLNEARDSMSMMDGMGSEGDIKEMQGKMLGQLIGSTVAPWMANKGMTALRDLAKRHPNAKFANALKAVDQGGEAAAYTTRNVGKLLQEDLRKNEFNLSDPFYKQFLRGAGRWAFNLDGGRNFRVMNDTAETLAEQTSFDGLTYRSINEVIPGFLARILKSTEGIRTGENDPDYEVYDGISGQFVAQRTREQGVTDTLFNKRSFGYYAGRFNEVISVIDPDKQLSEKARKALAKQLARDSDANMAFDPARYTDESNFDRSIDRDAIKELSAYFKDRYGIRDDVDDEGNRQQVIENRGQYYTERNRADLRYGNLKSLQPDIQRNLNLLKRTGDIQYLERIGIVTRNNDGSYSVNHDRYFSEIDQYIDRPEYADRGDVNTRLSAQQTRALALGYRDDVASNADVQNRALPNLDRTTVGTVNIDENIGYEKWWNDAGVITTSLEDQNRAWQELYLEALQEASHQRETMLELLKAISEKEWGGSGVGLQGEPGGEESDDRSMLSRISDLTLGKAGSYAWKGAKGAAKFGWKWGRKAATWGAKRTWGSFVNSARRIINFNRFVFGALSKVDQVPFDIYVKGEDRPRILAAKLRQGLYFDEATGKAVKRMKDIKGPLVDADGNIVISAEDIEKGLITRAGRAFENSGLKAWAREGINGITAVLSLPRLLKRGATELYKHFDKTPDVYVTGESTPRLLSLVMAAGGYFRKSDGKVIKHLEDIDGDVVDAQGNVILTHADMQKGLVDKYGKKIRRLKEKLINFGVKAFTLPLTLLRKTKDILKNLPTKAMNGLRRMGLNFRLPEEVLIGTTAGMVDRLDAIYQLLDKRMPGGDKDYRDWNGDGVREGSLEDLKRKRAEKEGEKGEGTGKGSGKGEEKEKKKGILGSLFDMLGDTALGKRLMASPLGKILGGLGSILSGGASLTGLLGKGLLKGSGALLRGGLSAAGWLGRGALMAGGAALNAVGGLSGLGAALISPVGLAIAGGALAAYAGWKIYQHFAEKPDPMQKLRLIAYGAKGDDKGFNKKLLQTETYLTDHVVMTGDTIGFDPKADSEKILEIWELSLEDTDRMNEWKRWYLHRFIPVFARAFKLWKEHMPDEKKFMEMDDYPNGENKVKWSEAFIWPSDSPDSPYYVEANPLGSAGATLYIAGQDVKKLMESQLEVIRKEYQNQIKKYTHDEAIKDWSKMSDAQRKSVAPNALRGQKASLRFNDKRYNSAGVKGRQKLDATAVVESVDRRGKKWMAGGYIDELTSLRIRAYGLEVPLLSQIKVLMELEDAVEPGVVAEGKGVKYGGNLAELYKKFASKFGRDVNSKQDQNIWFAWMNNRFLPVFLTYYQQVGEMGGQGLLSDVVQNLKDSQRWEIGEALVAAQYKDEKGALQPVWSWNSCGFSGTKANMSSSSTKSQLDLLKEYADKEKVREKNAEASQEDEDKLSKIQEQLMKQAGYEKKDGVWQKKSRITGGLSNAEANYNPNRNEVGRSSFTASATSSAGLGSGGPDITGLPNMGLKKPASGPGPEAGRRAAIKSAVKHGITDPMEMAMFLSNLEHESGNYRYVRELNYTKPDSLKKAFSRKFRDEQDAAQTISMGPEAVFERVYGMRKDLGNTQKGDGAKYLGRGYIQVTGKANYARLSKILNKDLVSDPSYLETPEGAAEGSVAWWLNRGNVLRDPAKRGDVRQVRYLVNGGYNGLRDVEQRSAYWIQAAKSGTLKKMMDEVAGSTSDDQAEGPSTASQVKNEEAQETNSTPTSSNDPQAPSATATPEVKPSAASGTAPAPGTATPTSGSFDTAKAAAGQPASTPAPSELPSNPGANRGISVPNTPAQVAQSATQTSAASENFYGSAGEILRQQLTVQQNIEKNTGKTNELISELIQAVKGSTIGKGSTGSSQQQTISLPNRPQGISPTRTRYAQ